MQVPVQTQHGRAELFASAHRVRILHAGVTHLRELLGCGGDEHTEA